MTQKMESSTYEAILKQTVRQPFAIFRLFQNLSGLSNLDNIPCAELLVRNFFEHQVQSDVNTEFDKAKNSVMSGLDRKIQTDLVVLQSLQAIYYKYEQVVVDYFDLYASLSAKTYPSIISLYHAPLINSPNMMILLFPFKGQGYIILSLSGR